MTDHPSHAAVAETVRAMFASWVAPGTAGADRIPDLFADDFTGLGTGPGDRYRTRDDVRDMFVAEKAAADWDGQEYEVAWLDVRLLRDDVALVECQIRSEVTVADETYSVDPRVSMALVRGDGRWRITHFHFSMADAVMEEGDTLIEALERKTRVLEREVAERTAELEASLTDLKATQARLVQQEKMASLGALTAGIAHEIKNPLNFVTNFAGLSRELADELAAAGGEAERDEILGDLRANAEKIEEHGRRADAIVRSMMEHARVGTGERRAVDLNALVAEYAAHAEHAHRARHPDTEAVLDVRLGDGVGRVELVPEEVGRVLVNLVDNALAAVRQRAGAEPGGYAPAVTVSTRRTEGGVEVRVADNGPGMAEAVRARVFEPFFTAKPPGEGTGLGLSLSHDVVVQGHGGTLAVESAPGAGATFVVRLPVAPRSN